MEFRLQQAVIKAPAHSQRVIRRAGKTLLDLHARVGSHIISYQDCNVGTFRVLLRFFHSYGVTRVQALLAEAYAADSLGGQLAASADVADVAGRHHGAAKLQLCYAVFCNCVRCMQRTH